LVYCLFRGRKGCVQTDICGPMNTPSLAGARYFLLLVDFQKMWVYFLKEMLDVLSVLKKYKAAVEGESGRRIRALSLDN
jgi:hypothetical protein